MAKKNIDDLRELLFETIEGVKAGKIDVERAKMIGDLSQVMVNSAKVEVEYAKATGGTGSEFLDKRPDLPRGITGTRTHRLVG
jgi:selenophosphate synthetase-related protein